MAGQDVTRRDKKKRPLRHAVVLNMITGTILLAFIAGAVVLILYPYTVMRGFKKDTDCDMDYTLRMLDRDYLEDIAGRTKEIYYSMSESEKADPFTDEYRDRFRALSEEPGFKEARSVLFDCRETEEMSNIAFFFYDDENDRFVIIIDGDTDENFYLPGQYVSEENGSIDKLPTIKNIQKSEWLMSLNYAALSGWTFSNYRDVTGKNGDVIGLIYTDMNVNEFYNKLFLFVAVYVVLMLIVVARVAGRATALLKERIIDPVTTLSRTAVAYTERDKTSEDEGVTYFRDLDINTGDEIETLWESLTDMEADMNDTMKRIREMTSARERIDTELSIARQIQAAMLPGNFPAFPERTDFELFAVMNPAREVGGDFYEFFLIDDDHIALAIADVSDKGVPAALFMMIARTLVKNQARLNSSPAEILSFANARLCEGNEAGQFVTIWLAIVELSTGRCIAGNAGHEHPALCRAGGSYELQIYDHSMPLGVLEDNEFSEHEFMLYPGDRIFVYTDGVTDAINSEEERFGAQRMLEALNKDAGASPEETLENVKKAIIGFEDGTEHYDDITMLSFVYRSI